MSICILAAIIIAGIALYFTVCSVAPGIVTRQPTSAANISVSTTNQLIIPELGLNLPILVGDKSVLEQGMWHRFPERGDPLKGGNFILSGHRFVIGNTPGSTISKSYLYHVDKLKVGDVFYVDWNKKRYRYQIKQIYNVKPTALDIEAQSATPKLTLYTCTNGGASDGRVVIDAVVTLNN